MAQSTLEVNA